mmetsp:Transcript_11605/g.22837  ORF Transcript_11605/g.22837 Transcript_11605/m.22837 type:complete len:246 (+) Transcript_11605:306-1043(+)
MQKLRLNLRVKPSASEKATTTSNRMEKKKKKHSSEEIGSGKTQEDNTLDDEEVSETKLFVGNCNYGITDEIITEFFKDCGEITEIYWVCNKESGRFSGMGFVTFADARSAKKALALHEQECMGRRIKLSMAKPRKERPERKPRDRVKRRPVKPLSNRPDECYTVFVGNLSYEVNDEQMIKFAEEKSEGQGTVTGVRWITDRETGDFRGAGFVDFDSVEAVDAFVKQNGEVFLGRQLRVDYAMPKN